jgi:hypothetical protein
MGLPPPPPLPKRPNADLAGKVLTWAEDGALWRWTGSAWDLIDPPGTHTEAIRHSEIVVPLLSLAGQLDRDGISEGKAIEELLAFPGCDPAALYDAAAMVSDSSNERARRVGELLRRAAAALM